jgi:hypothetical protein
MVKTKGKRPGYTDQNRVFTLVPHRELPVDRVSQVCVKLEHSCRIHFVFLVREPETQGEQPKEEPKKAVSVDVKLTRLTL